MVLIVYFVFDTPVLLYERDQVIYVDTLGLSAADALCLLTT